MPRKISVEIVGDERDLLRAFKKSEQAANGFAGKTKKAGSGITRSVLGVTGAFVGVGGLAAAASAAFGEMAEGQKVAAQTRAVLKSTGGAANVTAKRIDRLAGELSRMSGVDDELIKSSENVLLTFTKVRNGVGKTEKIFDDATRVILDMSVALGTDLQSATIQVGKALNDPIRGLSALRRVGVQFTDAQEDQIKALVKSGKTMEAQKVILRELNREFGGSAEAAGDTLPGKLNILRESLLNLGGTIAEKFSPALTKLVDKIVSWLNKSKNQERILKAVDDAAAALSDVLGVLRGAMEKLNDITGSTKNTVKLLFAAFVAFKTAKIAATLTTIAANVGLVGTRATASTAKVRTLRASLRGLAKIGAIPILIELVLNKSAIDKFLKEHGLGFLTKSGLEIVGIGGDDGDGRGRRGRAPAPRTRAKAPAGPRGPRGPNAFNVTLEVDGKTLAGVVVNENQRRARQQTRSSRGRYGGQVLGGT